MRRYPLSSQFVDVRTAVNDSRDISGRGPHSCWSRLAVRNDQRTVSFTRAFWSDTLAPRLALDTFMDTAEQWMKEGKQA